MKILQMVWEYRYVIIAALFGGAYVWQNRQHLKETWMAELKQFITEQMLKVEKMAKEQIEMHGAEKMEWVVQKVLTEFVPKVPDWFKPLCSEQNVRFVAQWIFDHALDLLDDGKLNGSVK